MCSIIQEIYGVTDINLSVGEQRNNCGLHDSMVVSIPSLISTRKPGESACVQGGVSRQLATQLACQNVTEFLNSKGEFHDCCACVTMLMSQQQVLTCIGACIPTTSEKLMVAQSLMWCQVSEVPHTGGLYVSHWKGRNNTVCTEWARESELHSSISYLVWLTYLKPCVNGVLIFLHFCNYGQFGHGQVDCLDCVRQRSP